MHLLFVNESGHDEKDSPYAVLAGLAVPDSKLWQFVCQLHELEIDFFGLRLAEVGVEVKGKKFLNRKTFRLAKQEELYEPLERRQWAEKCLRKGFDARGQPASKSTKQELTALSQAKIAFCLEALYIASSFGAVSFAAVVARRAPKPTSGGALRRDYAFFFQRFFYFLVEESERSQREEIGPIVFDERDRNQCHLLVGQMERYFLQTYRGRERSSRLIPEPLFVHSDLSTLIQVADIIAYTISWGVRFSRQMTEPARLELADLAEDVLKLRYKTSRIHNGISDVWSFLFVGDLRPLDQRRD